MSVQAEFDTRSTMPSDIFAHLHRLHLEADRPDVRVIELGVRSGNSTAAFLLAAERNDGHVWSVDIAGPPPAFIGHPNWTFKQGDDLWLAAYLPDDVDVVFIDTSHHYDQTVAELELYVPKVRPGGVVLLHDTELLHPDGHPPTDPDFPVRVAVEEYVAEHGLPVEFVPGCNGLGVIRIPGG